MPKIATKKPTGKRTSKAKAKELNLDPHFFHSSRARGGVGGFSTKAQREPYSSHCWTYAAVNRIVQPTACLPKILVNVRDPSRIKYEDPILDLFQEPNPYLSGTELWELTLMYLLLPTIDTPGGQCFWFIENGRDEDIFNPKRDWPIQIWPYSDRVIKPLTRKNKAGANELVGWKMVVDGQTIMEFGLNDIIRFRYLNPYDLSHGLSPYSAAMTPVTQDLLADEFNTRFFANDAAIGGILTTDSEAISMEQLQQYSDYFDENYTGPGHAGRTAALAHGLKYDRFMLGNRDMQYMEQRKDNRYRIQAVFGVNEEEIGIYEKGMNRATAEQADRSVWQKTRLPLDQKILRTLNIKLFKYLYRGEWRLKSDTDHIEALRADYSDRIKDAIRLIHTAHVPPAEAFRKLNIPIDVDKYPWMEKSFVPMNMVDIALLADGYIPPQMGQPSPEKELVRVLSGVIGKKKTVHKSDIDEICRVAASASREERDKHWDDYVKMVLDPGEKSMLAMLKRQFTGMRNEMLDAVDAWLGTQKGMSIRTQKMNPAVFLFDLDGANEDMLKSYKPEAKEQMKRELKRLTSKYGDVIQWNVTDETVGKFVAQRKKWLESANGLTFDRAKTTVIETIEEGFKEQWTPQELAKQLKANISQRMNGISAGWASVIARTETGSITSASRFDAFKESKITKHEWLSAKDELVRPTHQFTDGQVVEVGQPFKNGLLYPLQAGAPPEEVINCRCDTIPRLEV